MKGVSQVIFLVITVIIGTSLLFLTLKTLGGVGEGIGNLEETGKSQQQQFQTLQGLADSCHNWLFGDKYDADSILNKYQLPDKMRPYEKIWSQCGEDLEDLAQNCYKKSEADSKCAGNGLIKSDNYEIETCSSVCINVLNIFDKCKSACNDNAPICFERIINEVGSQIDDDDLTITDREISRGCGG